MCGIVGFVRPGRLEPDAGLALRRMLAMIRHRGPDEFGIYLDSTVALGSARLSIIDVEGGQQPIANEDSTLWIVFNGEIYNYVELRPELEARGHRFTTHSDTEVFLHMYEEYGADCLGRMNGQFAAAIWDARRQSLFVARDRLGVRPLFYAKVGGALFFGSEIKALRACPEVPAEIDPVALEQTLTYWSTLPGRSIFKGIEALPAGHYMVFESGNLVVKRWWRTQFPSADETRKWVGPNAEAQYSEEFQRLLVDSTLIRLRSDVPVGAYLSGGLDSSMIAKIITARANNRLSTFSVTFEDRDFDESAYQIRMARQLGTAHEVVHATNAEIARVFPAVVWHMETAVTRTAPAPMFLLSQLVRNAGYKVVLTGEGADEFLGGYDIFKEALIRRFWARHPESNSRPALLRRLYADIPGMASANFPFLSGFFKEGLLETQSPYYSHAIRWKNTSRLRRLLKDELRSPYSPEIQLPSAFGSWGVLQKAQFLEIEIFLSQYLLSSQGDRVAMAHSVESRHPFLDYRLVEFCNRLPASMKMKGLTDKYLLRKMGRDMLPREIWERPKRPYRAPIHKSFFCHSAPDYVKELLSPDAIRRAGFFKLPAVEQLTRKFSNGSGASETGDMALAAILSTQLLHHQFVSDFKSEPPVPEPRAKVRTAALPA